MSRKITQPVNQVRLTNVAVVRMNRHGKRFEVACYRNKILNYRQRIETDLTEVLQTDRIFTNVSKGQFASSKDLVTAFGTSDQDAVCQIILDKGQVQVSDMERNAVLENTAREVANMVVTKCVHPVSNRPYTINQVRSAMKQAEFSIQSTSSRSVKQQFLDCVRVIQEKKVLNIQRAKMELAIVFLDIELTSSIMGRLEREAQALICVDNGLSSDDARPNDDSGGRLQFLVDPSKYRVVDTIAKESGSSLEMLRPVVREEGDVDVSLELQRKNLRQSEQAAAFKRREQTEDENASFTHDLVSVLADDMANVLKLEENMNERQDQDGLDDDQVSFQNQRKKNKKAQKKSKKAKRREKEELSLRQARVEAEKTRKAEREFRLGDQQKCIEVSTVGASSNATMRNVGTKACNTCGGAFTPSEYRNHFRSDWHRYNIKLKMNGAKPVEEKEFLILDSEAFFENNL